MQKTKFEFEEKHHVIEVDGIDYEIPQRTAELEKKIIEHEKNRLGMSEYEANIQMLTILFGKKAVDTIFPEKNKTNLDKLAKLTKISVDMFMAEYNSIQQEEMKEKVAELEPYIKKLNKITEATNKIKK